MIVHSWYRKSFFQLMFSVWPTWKEITASQKYNTAGNLCSVMTHMNSIRKSNLDFTYHCLFYFVVNGNNTCTRCTVNTTRKLSECNCITQVTTVHLQGSWTMLSLEAQSEEFSVHSQGGVPSPHPAAQYSWDSQETLLLQFILFHTGLMTPITIKMH